VADFRIVSDSEVLYGQGSTMSPRLADADALAHTLTAATRPDNHSDGLEEEVVALFDEFRNPLLRYLSSFGIAFSDCEDVIQEIFLSLFQHLHRGKSRDNLAGWLFRVGHNLALKCLYRTRRNLQVLTDARTQSSPIDPAPTPEDRAVDDQTRRRLLAVVEALPEQDRQCLVLRAEGFRYREIAGILNMSLGGVSLSLTRSLGRIARRAEQDKS
jgi:RNA polymerase sigma-70 factor (ECF subfamily)